MPHGGERVEAVMNKAQRDIAVYGLYGLSALLVFIFWRVGTQYDYSHSLLICEFGRAAGPSYTPPDAVSGLRLRMGITGVFCCVILPALLAGSAAFMSKSD